MSHLDDDLRRRAASLAANTADFITTTSTAATEYGRALARALQTGTGLAASNGHLQGLAAARDVHAELLAAMEDHAVAARAAGYSWEAIGGAAGLSASAAQRRWSSGSAL